MTGLDLETFLRLVRADRVFWVGAGAIAGVLLLLIWAARGRSKSLQRCLVLSLAIHVGLVVYGGPSAIDLLSPERIGLIGGDPEAAQERIRSIELVGGADSRSEQQIDSAQSHPATAASDRGSQPAKLLEFDPQAPLPELEEGGLVADSPPPSLMPDPARETPVQSPPAIAAATPEPELEIPEPQPRSPVRVVASGSEVPDLRPLVTEEKAQVDLADSAPEEARRAPMPLPEPPVALPRPPQDVVASAEPPRRASVPLEFAPSRPLPDFGEQVIGDPAVYRQPQGAPTFATEPVGITFDRSPERTARRPSERAEPELAVPDLDSRLTRQFPQDDQPGGAIGASGGSGSRVPRGSTGAVADLAMREIDRRSGLPAVPLVRPGSAAGANGPALPDVGRGLGGRPLPEIPEVYRSRVAPNRSALAREAGASPASEEAVARALEWLARHQDDDGRWNAGSRHGTDGRTLRGESSFTAHCPEDDVCVGECYYWEADTAMTGLALLAYLGAGHTHRTGPYATAVERGLSFLLRVQKPDGDLRGASIGVGIYCHAIAALALCEAYVLTGDERLRPPVERAVAFLLKSRTSDGIAWRYQPGDRFGGDTSILGWAVMMLKSAREVGVAVPEDARTGALAWLQKVAQGRSGGLAIYRPNEGYRVTPTMTAEAWACRQFFDVGGPGPASDEAAAYLMQHGPDRDPFNLYYWYYATLAMYQHGGDNWVLWNARVRDQLVRRQERGGHADGSWDPRLCKDKHDSLGGRVYTTALAALTLEVYYRYLRLYDAPSMPASVEAGDPTDAAVRRTSGDSGEQIAPLTPVPEN